MLDTTRRPHETTDVSTFHASVQEIRVSTGPAAERADAAGLIQLDQLVRNRLGIARLGLAELRRRLAAGEDADAEIIRHKIDEELHMLQRRVRREVEKAAPAGPRRSR